MDANEAITAVKDAYLSIIDDDQFVSRVGHILRNYFQGEPTLWGDTDVT